MKKTLLLFLFIGLTLGSQIGTVPIKNKFIKPKIKSKISIEYPKNKISSNFIDLQSQLLCLIILCLFY